MDSPRGRIYLMKSGLEGRAAMSDAFVRHFDQCLGCMACVTACPSGVQYSPLIEATRGQIERRHERSFADRLFRSALFAVLPYPSRLRIALGPIALLTTIELLFVNRSPAQGPAKAGHYREGAEPAQSSVASAFRRTDAAAHADAAQSDVARRLQPSDQGFISRVRALLALAPPV